MGKQEDILKKHLSVNYGSYIEARTVTNLIMMARDTRTPVQYLITKLSICDYSKKLTQGQIQYKTKLYPKAVQRAVKKCKECNL